MKILGIESSCDDSAIALYDSDTNTVDVNLVKGQEHIHNVYGGVHTSFAATEHADNLGLLLYKSGIKIKQVDLIAYTNMPGLKSSLLMGACFAKTLQYCLGIQAIAINHLHGHILSPWIGKDIPAEQHLSLVITGGHTQMYLVQDQNFTLISDTKDDAVGELFDKTARIIGLKYPGGPQIEELAKEGNEKVFDLPLAMVRYNNLDFSFSGLKSHIARLWNCHENKDIQSKRDLCLALQNTVSKILCLKLKKAILETNVRIVTVVGGVSANNSIRRAINLLTEKLRVSVYYAEQRFCTDNAAMIAFAGYHKYIKNRATVESDLAIYVNARDNVL